MTVTTVTTSMSIRLAAIRGAASTAKTITSKRISELTGINSTQIRRDLSMLQIWGKRGVGYDSATLRQELVPHLDGTRKELERLSRLMGLAYKGVIEGDE